MAHSTEITRCYNCFQEIPAGEGSCPHCGFDLAENQADYPTALPAGTVLNGRYIIGRVLGQGGFGITYLALDTQLNARVAVKEFMPNDIATRVGTTVSVAMKSRSEDFTYGAERFMEEARTLAKFMGHPNIAGVSSYFDENDTSYFVMDYIEGISFKTYIASHGGKVSVEDACNVMIPVLRALTAVHAEGFIHRDVTPDNIYITKDGLVKLLDFGSARYSIGDKSKSLDVILKVGYAPKEQYIRRSRQGPFTDVYSCAACFYAAITGFLPPESLERLDQDTLVPISQQGIDIPEYLDKAILKGLAVQPEDRFQSAAEFLEAIETQQVVEVPGKAPAAPEAPPKKKVRPALLAVAAAVVIAAAVGVGALLGGGGEIPGEGGDSTGGGVSDALAPKVTIDGEAYSTALTELDLSDHVLEDLTPLTAFTEVESLELVVSPSVPDLTPLASLTKLEELDITMEGSGAYGYSDISALYGLTEFRSLRIRTYGLATLEGIQNLSKLTYLNLDGQGAVFPDLEPLGTLKELEELRLPIMEPNIDSYMDLSPLAGCTALEYLRMDHKAADLTPLSGLVHLKSLSLEDGYMGNLEEGFASVEPLSSLTELTSLSLRSTRLTSLDGLETLTKLETLNLSVRSLTDISALRDLEKLTNVSITCENGNHITDLTPLDHVANVSIS